MYSLLRALKMANANLSMGPVSLGPSIYPTSQAGFVKPLIHEGVTGETRCLDAQVLQTVPFLSTIAGKSNTQRSLSVE